MEAKQEMTLDELRAAPPKALDDVDQWLANYMALSDASRAEALRIDRLHDAAPDLLYALTMVRDADEDCKRDGLPTIPEAARATIDAALAKAVAA